MFTIYRDLPDHYESYFKIDMQENKKEFIMLNILSILAIIPFIFGLAIIGVSFTVSNPIHLLIGLLSFFFGSIIYIILHELVHAFFFKLKNKIKVTYKFHGFAASASAPGNYFQKGHYLIISLAPFMLFNIIFITSLFFLNGGAFFIAYLLFMVHFSGCSGDLYVFFRLFRKPKDILVEDYGIGMRIFKPIDEQ